MVAGGTAIAQKSRPTVRKYIKAMLDPSPARHQVYDRQSIQQKDSISDVNRLFLNNRIRSNAEVDVTLRGADQAQLKREASETPVNRVDPIKKLIGDELGDLLPTGLKIDIPLF